MTRERISFNAHVYFYFIFFYGRKGLISIIMDLWCIIPEGVSVYRNSVLLFSSREKCCGAHTSRRSIGREAHGNGSIEREALQSPEREKRIRIKEFDIERGEKKKKRES